MNGNSKVLTAEKSNDKMLIISMASIGVLCALFIVLTYEGTRNVIEENKAKALEKAVFQVIPDIAKTRTLQLNADRTFSEMKVNDPKADKVYAGYDHNGNFKGVAFQGSGKAYGDVLGLLFGYDPKEQKIIGFYVLESKETPGIGNKIEYEPFTTNFSALDAALNEDLSSLKNEIKTVKQGEKTHSWEIDGITGATITSRAVGNILNASAKQWIPVVYKNKDVFSSIDKAEK